MIKLGVRVLQLFANRSNSSSSHAQPSLDFSNATNSGYRGFYV